VNGTTVGEDIICELEKMLENCECPFSKYVCSVEDCSSVMTGSKNGLVWKLSEKLGSKIHEFHCVTHQEVLYGKC
jgi:hypothetical protein